MDLKQLEIDALNGAAALLVQYEPQIDQTVGPIEVTVINGALHVADTAFAKLPFGIGGLIDQALSSYAQTVEANLPSYTNQGITGVANYLKAIAAKLAAG